MTYYIPEVKSIIGKDDEEAAEQGYKPFVPRNEEPDWEKFVRKD